MAGAKMKGRIVVLGASVATMAKGFPRYGSETEQLVRTQQVESNPVLEAMMAAWKPCDVKNPLNTSYTTILEAVKKLKTESKYSAKDVETFSIALSKFQNEENFQETAGLFLSALMNSCKDKNYVIHTDHLAKPISYVGYKNTKNITVKGAVGKCVGYEMIRGTITVEGGAGNNAGYEMARGNIIVGGDAGDWVGLRMKGGTLTVNKNAGEGIGRFMDGGKIHLNGDYKGIADHDITHGKIFHKGKLIVDT